MQVDLYADFFNNTVNMFSLPYEFLTIFFSLA